MMAVAMKRKRVRARRQMVYGPCTSCGVSDPEVCHRKKWCCDRCTRTNGWTHLRRGAAPVIRRLKRERRKFAGTWVIDDEAVFPVDFCPVCGGTDITFSSHWDHLIEKYVGHVFCRTCRYDFVIHVVKNGKRRFPVRHDPEDRKPDYLPGG